MMLTSIPAQLKFIQLCLALTQLTIACCNTLLPAVQVSLTLAEHGLVLHHQGLATCPLLAFCKSKLFMSNQSLVSA